MPDTTDEDVQRIREAAELIPAMLREHGLDDELMLRLRAVNDQVIACSREAGLSPEAAAALAVAQVALAMKSTPWFQIHALRHMTQAPGEPPWTLATTLAAGIVIESLP